MDYQTPEFFKPVEAASGRTYRQWLTSRAKACQSHDRNGQKCVHEPEYYRRAIHNAMKRSGGLDEYNGKPIDWMLAFQNRNEKAGSKSRRKFAAAPSIDHVTGGGNDVAICRDDTNSAKGCMTENGFYEFCASIVAHGGLKRG